MSIKNKDENIKINWKDVLVRSGKTFVQAIISYFIMSMSGVNFFNSEGVSDTVIRGILLGALAAGISAVWNSVLSPLLNIDGTPTVKVIYVDRPVINSDKDDEYDGVDNG